VPDQVKEHLVFTTNGKKLYAIKLEAPIASFTISGTKGWNDSQVEKVRLLGSDAAVTWKMTPSGLRITPPTDLGKSQHAWSFEIQTDAEQHHPNVIVRDVDQALKGTKKVNLDGAHKK
jgi:alpha-L-fucosidase